MTEQPTNPTPSPAATPTGERLFTRAEVEKVMNRAADEVLAAVDAPDTGLRDGINLLVNAGLSFLDDPTVDLDTVAELNYDVPLDEVLSWVTSGTT